MISSNETTPTVSLLDIYNGTLPDIADVREVYVAPKVAVSQLLQLLLLDTMRT